VPQQRPKTRDQIPTYQPHPHHRNGTPRKSQWTIPIEAEMNAFTGAWTAGWFASACIWGLHFDNGVVTYLGVGQDHQTQVFLAKFVDGQGTPNWHGYPIDHKEDRPPEQVMDSWLKGKYFNRAAVRRILRGQRCRL
jgi:hypothetical protein